MKTFIILLILSSITATAQTKSTKPLGFKIGTYIPITQDEDCVETKLRWDQDVLVFGKNHFTNFDKDTINFSNIPHDKKTDCEIFWKTTTEGRQKIKVSYLTKCPNGYTEETKQSFEQIKERIVFDSSFSINDEVKASSFCEYQRQVEQAVIKNK